jgi:hypothetical protein
MYNAAEKGENTEFIQQLANIEEHLNRGIKDFAIFLCFDFYVPLIRCMMQARSRCIDDDVFCGLRHIYHELKNIVADIRLGGQKLLRFDNSEVSWLPNMINIISDFKELLNENIQLNNLYQSTLPNIIHPQNNPIKK